jgi:hypothetical protein
MLQFSKKNKYELVNIIMIIMHVNFYTCLMKYISKLSCRSENYIENNNHLNVGKCNTIN